MAGMSKLYEKGTKKGDDKPEEKAPAEKKEAPAAKKDGDEAKDGDAVKARHLEELRALHKAQEGERKDLHGNHREEHRQMAGRHEKALRDLHERQAAEVAAGGQGMANGGATAPGAATDGGGEAPEA